MNFLNKKYNDRKNHIINNSSGKERERLLIKLNSFFNLMKDIGVNNDKDFKDFYYISRHSPSIIKEISGSSSKDLISKVSSYMYKNREEYPINTIINFYRAAENALDKSIIKKAYPQAYDDFYVQRPYNLNKWLDTTRQIYKVHKSGHDLAQSTEFAIKDWDTMEKNDFKNWLKYYQSGQQLAYKTAFTVGDGVDLSRLKASLPGIPGLIYNETEEESLKSRELDKKQEIERKRQALIGRLNSAEKIFYTQIKDLFKSESEAEAWLETLHSLKRKVQSIKNAETIQDIMVRTANQFKVSGSNVSAGLMLKLAQMPEAPPDAPPEGDMGLGDPLMGDSEPPLPDASGDDVGDPEGAMREFLENIGVSIDDKKEAKDNFDGAIIVVGDDNFENIKTSQVLNSNVTPTTPNVETTVPAAEVAPESTETVEPEKKENTESLDKLNQKLDQAKGDESDRMESGSGTQADEAIENALKNVSYKDIIVKLEALATLFKHRQVVRELTIVDLMMQSLGIASFFPSLAEATKSALDSNQYVLTRIEDILAKLRGAHGLSDGSLNEVKNKLETSDDNDLKKKQDKAVEKMMPTEEEVIEVEEPDAPQVEELTGPVNVEQKPVPPAAPPVPPAQQTPTPAPKV